MQRIAIIGSGMAGLTAARILKDAGHQVMIFEALSGKGMDSHSLNLQGGIVDSPLRVMNPEIWSNTLALAQSLGIEMFQVNTYMSCSWLKNVDEHVQNTTTWLSTGRSKIGRLPILADFSLSMQDLPKLCKGLLQLQRALSQFYRLEITVQHEMSLAQFINRYPIEPHFWHGCVMPVLYTLCTCDAKTLGDWVAKPLLDFLIKMQKGSPLFRMYGGTAAFVQAISQDLTFYSNAKVLSVKRIDQQLVVSTATGFVQQVDKVVVATPTHVIDFLDEQECAEELALLRQYQFTQGELLIHQDTQCMPHLKKHWSALSYMMDKNYQNQMFTVWLNAVEPSLKDQPDIFQSWNPTIDIDPDKIIDRVKLSRAIVDRDTAAHTLRLKKLQQRPRDIYFCGSWMCEGLPILESAVTSAMFVAEQLGAQARFKPFYPPK